MLSADPIVQEPHNAQNLNRYTYVLNNPLSYTDPTGLSFWRKYGRQIAGILVNAFMPGLGSFFTTFWGSVVTGFVSGVVSSGSLQGGLFGAFSAGQFHGIGAEFAQAAQANREFMGPIQGLMDNGLTKAQFATKVFAHGMAGGVMSALQGGKFGHGFLSAGVAQLAAPGIDRIDAGNRGLSAARVMAAAMVGGTVSAATGGKFANGALTAAFARAHNDEASNQRQKRALLMVGDPGLGSNNVGESFQLAAATGALSLESQGWVTETVRVSTVDDVRSALNNGSAVDRAYYFGHSGQSGLFPGETSDPGTNLYAADAALLTPGRLSRGAEMWIYGCNAGVGSSNMANTISYYIRRPVYAFTSGLHFSGSPEFRRAPPYGNAPNAAPVYMRPDNGQSAVRFDSYRIP